MNVKCATQTGGSNALRRLTDQRGFGGRQLQFSFSNSERRRQKGLLRSSESAVRAKLRISETAGLWLEPPFRTAEDNLSSGFGAFSEPENPEPAFTKLVYLEGSL
jgi:hypothetical protein